MLVTFNTRAHGNITMFGDIAVRLLELMGHSGTVPSALAADDVPLALRRLREGVASQISQGSELNDGGKNDSANDPDQQRVSLKHRALPLIGLLEAAARDKVPVSWNDWGVDASLRARANGPRALPRSDARAQTPPGAAPERENAAAPAAAVADTAKLSASRHLELQAMDSNKDGLVSRQEYIARSETLYGDLKKDSAGMISLKDLSPAAATGEPTDSAARPEVNP